MKKFILFLLVICVGASGYYFFSHAAQSKKNALHFHRATKKGLSFEKWVSFSPSGEHFIAYFPQKPDETTRTFPIPGNHDTLPYKEYKYELDGKSYSVSYTILPSEWTSYGNSLILGGALKIIMHEVGKVELVGKEHFTFKSFPALDYEHYSTTTGSAGSLILVGNMLYKVEMTYPLDKHDEVQDELCNFIENFTPEEISSSQPESLEVDTPQFPQ